MRIQCGQPVAVRQSNEFAMLSCAAAATVFFSAANPIRNPILFFAPFWVLELFLMRFSGSSSRNSMSSDAALRYSLVVLGAVVLGIGFYTSSLKKMIATYAFGIVAISGVVLPDWEFFNRDFSQWFSPMPYHDNSNPSSTPQRFRIYPMRLVVFTVLYGFGLYKWWKFVSS